ncbi:hypothetical protein MD484_g7853, partial [Candolleomyces efflorescens]
MSLETGKYIITSRSTEGGLGPYGHSEGPLTKVVALPSAVDKPVWKLTKVEEGLYTITQDGGVAIEQKGFLFLSEQDDKKHLWRLESISHQGENAYTIMNAKGYGGSGWSVPITNGANKQVAVRTLIVHPTWPPRYPEFELFDIVKDDSDDAN